jgi:uncharacterized membrane protein YkgB
MLRLSINVLRTTLVVVFLAFGYVKFFAFEADGVAPLIAAHPLLAWLQPTFGHAGASAFLGVFEITAGVLLATRPLAPRLSALGGIMGMATFLVTVTLFWFVPGVFEASAGGFPAISGTGGFLLKDAVLFGASFVCLAESLDAARSPRLSLARA